MRFLGGSENLYAYLSGDPINSVDPLGLLNPTKFLSGVGNTLNAGRLYAIGALKLGVAAGLSIIGPGNPGSVATAAWGFWNLKGGFAAQQRGLQQLKEAIDQPWSDATWKNLLGVLPFGQHFDDPCEPGVLEFFRTELEAADWWEILSELGTLAF